MNKEDHPHFGQGDTSRGGDGPDPECGCQQVSGDNKLCPRHGKPVESKRPPPPQGQRNRRTLWLLTYHTATSTHQLTCGLFPDKEEADAVTCHLKTNEAVKTTSVVPITLFENQADWLLDRNVKARRQEAYEILSKLTEYDLEVLGIDKEEIMLSVGARQNAPEDKKLRHAYLLGYETGYKKKAGDTAYKNPYPYQHNREPHLAAAYKQGFEDGLRDRDL